MTFAHVLIFTLCIYLVAFGVLVLWASYVKHARRSPPPSDIWTYKPRVYDLTARRLSKAKANVNRESP